MSITAMRQARAKIISAQGCHPNATRTLLDEADELLCVAINEAEACEPVAYQEFTETGEWFLSYGKHPTAKQNPLFLAAGAQDAQQEPEGPLVEGWQLTMSDGHAGYGVYAHMTEYPDEGAIFLLAAGAQPKEKS